jgi:hypothetical protein
MKFKLFLLMLLSASIPAVAQTAAVTGVVVDAGTGAPISGATISIQDQGITVTTGPGGDFRISTARPGEAVLTVSAPGYSNGATQVRLYNDQNVSAGNVIIVAEDDNEFTTFNEENNNEILVDESMLEDEEGNSQTVTALSGASDNIYYKFTRYGYSPLYSNYRGIGSRYQETYINALPMNDIIRGGFSFSQLGGMTSRAFRNNTSTVGMGAASYGFGGLAGSQNFNTITDTYAPGFNGSLAYTNSNYNYRAMATYSTGLTSNGFAFTVSAIGRYADEGITPGTFYNSGGLFMSLEKVFDKKNSLTLTAWGAPTQYANGKATTQEAYDLTGDNLYNPSWGWQSGKKRSDNIREKFDPTVMLTWLHKGEKTTLTTSAAFRWVNFARTRLNYYKGNDPKPDYYKNLPSYFTENQDTPDYSLYNYYADLWTNNYNNIQQINWDAMYQANYLNNISNQGLDDADKTGSSYIQQMEHSNQFNFIVGTNLNHRFSDNITLQGGLNYNYTQTSEYMTIRDLLGGEFWVDVDPFSDRDMYDPTASTDILQNDLDHPNRRVVKGDRFGYDYNIYAMKAQAWLQNQHNYAHWDINYGVSFSYENFYRYGHMRNGRAPQNSLGKSKTLDFEDYSVKAGITYKLDGRNYFTVNAQYATEAPLVSDVYISPRIKDTTIDDPKSQKTLSVDGQYSWNYRRFRGTIGAYFINMSDAVERMGFYDESLNTYTNFALSGVKRQYKGIELGMAYKILPSLTASFAGTYAKFQYKNNPMGMRSVENGLYADSYQQVYLKNYTCTSTPQLAFNIALDWQAPKMFFVNVNASYLAEYYVKLAYPFHEQMSDIWTVASNVDEVQSIINSYADQPKLDNQWVLNASVGKLIYLTRKLSLNLNLSVSNILNNKDLVINAFQQSRVDTKRYNVNAYPTKLQYAQGIKVYFNVGVRF